MSPCVYAERTCSSLMTFKMPAPQFCLLPSLPGQLGEPGVGGNRSRQPVSIGRSEHSIFIKQWIRGAEMAPWLRVLAAPAEPSSVPSLMLGNSQLPVPPAPWSQCLWVPACTWHTHNCQIHTRTQKFFKKNTNIFKY